MMATCAWLSSWAGQQDKGQQEQHVHRDIVHNITCPGHAAQRTPEHHVLDMVSSGEQLVQDMLPLPRASCPGHVLGMSCEHDSIVHAMHVIR